MKYYSKEAVESTLIGKTIFDCLFDCNKDYLNGIALQYFGRKILYGQMFSNIEKTACAYTAVGIKKGDTVTICSVMTPETIYSFYALNIIGAIANMVDPRSSVEGISEYISESNSKVVVVIDAALGKITPFLENGNVETIIVVSPADSMPFALSTFYSITNHVKTKKGIICWPQFIKGGESITLSKRTYEKDLPTVIMHTGGTTGNPKGVLYSDDSYNFLSIQLDYQGSGMERGHKFLDIMPPFIAYGMACGVHQAMCAGCTLVLVPKFDPMKFDRLIMKYKPQHFWGVPTHLDAVTMSKRMKKADLSFLIRAGVGGDSLNKESEVRINEFLANHKCKYAVTKGYGMTEVNSAICVCIDRADKVGSVGIPLVHSIVSAFEPGTQNELKIGEVGEICITGPAMMIGYLNNPEETDKVMQKHADGRIWIHTGDSGYVDEDGFVFILDRIKRMIIREDGFKVYPSIIENVITKSDAVENCAVVGVRNINYTQGVNPKAFVVLNGKYDKETAISMIWDICRKELAEYCLPSSIVVIDELPLTPIGKIDYMSLSKINE